MKGTFEFIEHSADIGVRCQAESLVELFCLAARAMNEYLFGADVFRQGITEKGNISLQAPDLESLLVDWLSSLLTISATTYSACVKYDFTSFEANSLESQVSLAKALAQEEIKAVTYSGLHIEKVNNVFHASIIFDI